MNTSILTTHSEYSQLFSKVVLSYCSCSDQKSFIGSLNSLDVKKKVSKYHCVFCNVSHDNVDDFRIHCSTQSHQRTVMSDEGRDWKKRPPPRGLTADTYK